MFLFVFMRYLFAHLHSILKPTNTYEYNPGITNSETVILGG